jgi:hypothetical protein
MFRITAPHTATIIHCVAGYRHLVAMQCSEVCLIVRLARAMRRRQVARIHPLKAAKSFLDVH